MYIQVYMSILTYIYTYIYVYMYPPKKKRQHGALNNKMYIQSNNRFFEVLLSQVPKLRIPLTSSIATNSTMGKGSTTSESCHIYD